VSALLAESRLGVILRRHRVAIPGRPAMNLVQSRECGECTVCCKVLPVDTKEFRKTSGVLCQHCREGVGCGIYHSRPPVCRDWYCGWRLLPYLPDDWRPDRSGVIVYFLTESEIFENEIPSHYQTKVMFKFIILSEAAIERLGFAEIIGGLVASGILTFLAICGPAGYQQAKVFINEAIKDAVAHGDRDGAMAVLRQSMVVPSRHEFELSPPSNTKSH
jgi:hypothetical protein